MAKGRSASLFRPSQSGACEAILYTFTEYPGNDPEGPRVLHIAASELLQAVSYVHRWHEDFRIQRVEAVGIVEMLAGSPLH